jgi:hypothetical protein
MEAKAKFKKQKRIGFRSAKHLGAEKKKNQPSTEGSGIKKVQAKKGHRSFIYDRVEDIFR